jgi:hypothetical protein
MVEFFNAEAAHGTVFRAGGLIDQACSTLYVLFKYDTIKFKAFSSVHKLTFLCVFVQLTWVHPTGHEVACITQHHNESAYIHMVTG